MAIRISEFHTQTCKGASGEPGAFCQGHLTNGLLLTRKIDHRGFLDVELKAAHSCMWVLNQTRG